MTLAKKIRALRVARRMTIKETAAMLGSPASTYRDWEYGRKVPADKLLKLAETFHVPLSEFGFGNEDRPTNIKEAIVLLTQILEFLKDQQAEEDLTPSDDW